MNGTPRLRSSFPSTPGTTRKSPEGSSFRARQQPSFSSRLAAPSTEDSQPLAPASVSNAPVIPLELIDAPSQRLYAAAIWGLLIVWRLYDWFKLMEDNTESLSLFLKWALIDAIFVFAIPTLRIPWLEWSMTATSFVFVAHAIVDGMLMFRIPLPIEGWLLILTRTLFEKEVSISENMVRPASILNNASIIMGKQIINILPEGSAILNPGHLPYCLDHRHVSVKLPIYFNQTKPLSVELIRFDLETNSNETIAIPKNVVNKRTKHQDDPNIEILHYTAKKTGLYRLNRIIDESNLEVQRRMSETLVVHCPKAVMKSTASDKCLGDLSDVTMELEGTPPLKIVYSRYINEEDRSFHFQSNQPDKFVSPLLFSSPAGSLISAGSQDVSWARSRRVVIPLNESMTPGGKWRYSIDEIHDAAGNFANYSSQGEDGEHVYPKGSHLEQRFMVHERPFVQLTNCDSRNPLMVASGESIQFPVQYKTPGWTPDDTSHTSTWKFSPLDSLTANGDHGDEIVINEYAAKNAQSLPTIKHAGLYTLTSVRSKFCGGEVREPASCLLLNPPEPQLSINAENIYDKCAGSSIGLLVDLDLIGTPPFVVKYNIISKNGIELQSERINGLRHQLELKPKEAGFYKYQFLTISDEIYTSQKLSGKDLALEQDVKPPASAHLRRTYGGVTACIEEPVEFSVELSGEKPFILEYELVHGGKRKKEKAEGIDSDVFPIKTEPLFNGGQYALALASVQDRNGCKIFLNEAVNFTVRHQRPKASFGQLDGKFKTVAIQEDQVSMPLRLTGQAPWTIKYRNNDETSGNVMKKRALSANDVIQVDQRGVYEILEVSDSQCPGTVDSNTAIFEVDWFPRPKIELADTAVLVPKDDRYLKREVCEGDIDTVDVKLIGSPPYHVTYKARYRPTRGATTLSNKEFDAGLGLATIAMDTSKPGIFEYMFTELSDNLYDHDPKQLTPLIIEQRVSQKPTAYFAKPGQSYKYCKEEVAGDEVISIKLEGAPPFYLEVDIKHQTSARPETVTIPNIESHSYDFRIPHRVLSLGTHQVSIRKVRDSKGCQQKTEYGAPHVQVQVYNAPTIYPLESRSDYCVGERISYTLSGQAPFEIYYTFQNAQKVAKSQSTNFKRIAEKPGNFTINAVSDKASDCKAKTDITKIIHEIPSVKISKGKLTQVDIHEGGHAAILFEFWGTPPFEFTYTRSTNTKKGQKSHVLETRHEISYEYSMTIQSSLEGTYEVVAIKDKYCAFSAYKVESPGGQKLLQF